MDGPLCKSLYAVLILFQSFSWSKDFLIRKIFICINNPIYPTFFCWLIQIFTFSYDKDIRATALNAIIQFYLFFQTLKDSVYQLPGRVENSSFSTQICPKNGFRFGISDKLSQNKNQHPQDLGLKFEKANIKIIINILEILRVCACVPVFRQNKQLWLFQSKFAQKWI